MDKPASRAAGREPRPRLTLRRLHGWAGALFAPAILFFAVSGLLQVFDLHKAPPGSERQPPAAVRAMAQLHKNQTLKLGKDPGPRPSRHDKDKGDKDRGDKDRGDKGPAPAKAEPLGQQLLKAYAAATSLVLALTTLVGIVIALRNRRERVLSLVLLLVGIFAPLGLLLLG
jgi:hypothetical protein